jgi:hypothetical protein
MSDNTARPADQPADTVLQPQLPQPPDPPDWFERAKQCRAEEWTLACDLLALGRQLLLRHLTQMRSTSSLAQIDRLLRLATRLGRLSTDLAQNPGDQSECRECCRAREEMEAALKRIYGEPAQQPGATELPTAETLT